MPCLVCNPETLGKFKNTGVGSLSLLQQIFPTQELNQDLLHCRWILYQPSYERSPFLYSHRFNTQEKCMFKKFKSGTLVSLTKFQKKRKKNLLTGIISTIIFQGEICQRSKWAQVCIHILLPPLDNHLTLASHTASQVLVSLPLCEVFLFELSLNTEHFLSL